MKSNENRIQRLDEVTASKIAAGEVVEKPAMVVKELVENAVDAGATEIIVDIRKGGKKLVRVVDNGSGIHRDDVDLMFERHATSKIRKIDDLYKTLTLGFRGEALASICAVAQVEVITMRETEEYGIKIEAAGGSILNKHEIGARRGTSISVRDLFYNTPARLKFLKSDSAELKHISEIMGHLALSHPEIAFKYTSDDKLIFKTPGDGKVENTIFSVYDRTLIRHLFEISGEYDYMSLKGYASKFDYTKGTKQQQIVFVNGRYVKSDLVKEAINLAYKPYLMNNRFPVCFLFLTITPEKIDVNIHPAKTEIKFHDDGEVKQFIYTALKKAFNLQNQIPEVSFTHREAGHERMPENQSQQFVAEVSDSRVVPLDKAVPIKSSAPLEHPQIPDKIREIRGTSNSLVKETQDNSKETDASYTGHVKSESHKDNRPDPNDKADNTAKIDTAETFESDDKTSSTLGHLMTFERHEDYVKQPVQQKADSREKQVNFDRVNLEPLIAFSEEINLFDNPVETDSVYDNLQYVGVFSNTYLIFEKEGVLYFIDQHAAHEKILYETFVDAYESGEILSQVLLIPEIVEVDLLAASDFNLYEPYFQKMGFGVEPFGDKSFVIREIPSIFNLQTARALFLEVLEGIGDKMDDVILERLMSKACKSAIKANDHLADIETEALISQLKQLREPYTCPHGRPIIISFSKSEIERKFKRIL